MMLQHAVGRTALGWWVLVADVQAAHAITRQSVWLNDDR
jgi:hypothetical protein